MGCGLPNIRSHPRRWGLWKRAPAVNPAFAGGPDGSVYSPAFLAGTGREQMSSMFTGGAMKAGMPE